MKQDIGIMLFSIIFIAFIIIIIFLPSKYDRIRNRAVEMNRAEYNSTTGELFYKNSTIKYIIEGE